MVDGFTSSTAAARSKKDDISPDDAGEVGDGLSLMPDLRMDTSSRPNVRHRITGGEQES